MNKIPTREEFEREIAIRRVHGQRELDRWLLELFDALTSQAENAMKRIYLAKQAFIADGYFKPHEVSDDIAPRIIELAQHLRKQAEKARDEGIEVGASLTDSYAQALTTSAAMGRPSEILRAMAHWIRALKSKPKAEPEATSPLLFFDPVGGEVTMRRADYEKLIAQTAREYHRFTIKERVALPAQCEPPPTRSEVREIILKELAEAKKEWVADAYTSCLDGTTEIRTLNFSGAQISEGDRTTFDGREFVARLVSPLRPGTYRVTFVEQRPKPAEPQPHEHEWKAIRCVGYERSCSRHGQSKNTTIEWACACGAKETRITTEKSAIEHD